MSSIRKYLTDEEANFIGIKKLNKRPFGNKSLYRIDPKKWKLILKERKSKKKTKDIEIKLHEDEIVYDDDDITGVKTNTVTNDYGKKTKLTAWNPETGKVMNVDEYCEYHSFKREELSSWKLVTHTGAPYYNLAFRDFTPLDLVDFDEIKKVIKSQIQQTYIYKKKKSKIKKDVSGVLKWADLHFGAHIKNLLITEDYDSNILLNNLMISVDDVNSFGFKKVHVHINGDLIESFSGLNHINSWMSMNKDEIGPDSVILCCNLLDKALSKINNLGCVKIVAGNHDRTSKANDEDVKGGAEKLIAWGLELKGYDVEFHPYVITHLVDKINHINLHGDKGISKRTTKSIVWDFGIKGVFNFIFEAHLHSLMEKLSVSQKEKFEVIKDDSIDHRRMRLQPFFTGNYYSETLSFFTSAGYCIVYDNGNGKPKVLTSSI